MNSSNLESQVSVSGYESRIPAVLVLLRRHFLLMNGGNSEGIFRLAPDNEACQKAKDDINRGEFDGCSDVNIVANLLKQFFRDFPGGICSKFPPKIIYQAAEADTEGANAVLFTIDEPWLSLILWLLDMLADVVKNEGTNKMTCQNIATCISPNLIDPSSSMDNPMAAMTKVKSVSDFVTKILAARLKFHHGYICSGI